LLEYVQSPKFYLSVRFQGALFGSHADRPVFACHVLGRDYIGGGKAFSTAVTAALIVASAFLRSELEIDFSV
jgi:hypothetical protein